MKEIFLLSGLGADKRVFDFLDLQNYKVNHLTWLTPEPRENMQAYAKRLAKGIHVQRPILIGVSFGGMMAIEIGKIMETEKIVLISSAKTCDDVPSNMLTRNLKLHFIIPGRFIKKPNSFLFWLFGATTQREKILLTAIMNDTDVVFFRWAMDKIITWKNKDKLANIIHIHGSQDRMLPFVTADYRIVGGGHLMIVNRASEIDEILRTIL